MSAVLLVAIVEVPAEAAVRCQATGCGHTVYKRVHIVRIEGSLRVLGSTCFEKQFKDNAVVHQRPSYTDSNGRRLTEGERELLIRNTENLIVQFESEKARSDQKAKQALSDRPHERRKSVGSVSSKYGPMDPSLEAEAKRRVQEKYGVDPNLPGWRGLVLTEAQALGNENAT